MALGTLALHQLEAKLPKVISPKTHGLVDYGHAAFFATMAAVCWKKNRRAAYAAAFTSAFVLVESLFTDYKYGVKKLIPFSVHGQMDGGFAAASLGIPKAFGFEGTVPATIFHVNAFVEATVVGLTDWSDERARAEEK
ncbi:MAG: hypothetical protein ACRYFU_21430 [Janthinobacterium lividum]